MAEKLSNIAVAHLIQELERMEDASEPKCCRSKIFNQIPAEFKVTVCLGCGKRYESSDCGCPAGSAENLRSESEIAELLNREDVMYKTAEETRGFEMDMAYPQYKENYSQQDVISVETWIQLQQWAQKRLNDETFGPSRAVREHMIRILDGIIPFDMRITSSLIREKEG